MADESEGEESRHLRERAAEANIALWNALLTVNGVFTAVFASAAVLQVGWPRYLFTVIIVLSMASCALLIMNLQSSRDFYDVLGGLSDHDVAVSLPATRSAQLQGVLRERGRVRKREHAVKVCLFLQAILILFAVGLLG